MRKKIHKFIFVVGGDLSGAGKGVTSAALGAIFTAKGFKATAIKADPYLNVDAGTMNPTEHGEVFVTDDGDETDQDMGNYERFLDTSLSSLSYMTSGRVYQTVIAAERALKYKGRCVQIVPHIPEEIIRRIERAAELHTADITIIEVGGTVGEYENLLFLEAARMMKLRRPQDIAIVLVSYLPVPPHIGEMKTKPTQHASRALNQTGLQADMIIARSAQELDATRREKLAVFCGVAPDSCISAPNVASIYEIPLLLEKQGVGNKLLRVLSLSSRPSRLRSWVEFNRRIKETKKPIRIALVGKYFQSGAFTLADSYISVIEALKHAAWDAQRKPVLEWVNAEEFEKNPASVKKLTAYDGILVPGGFGSRGIAGVLTAIRFAREKKIPYLGLCYGMQLACVEFARQVLGKKNAHTVEIDPHTPDPIIHLNPTQHKNVVNNAFGGTMRLGAYRCDLLPGSRTAAAYGRLQINERHRHRYEFNNAYRAAMDKAGLKIVGVNPESGLVEIVELDKHPFFVGTQFHPEFLSRPLRPHPLFRALIQAAKKQRK